MRKMKSRAAAASVLLCGILVLAGCAAKKEKTPGVDDSVAGFLFHFDQRAETVALTGFAEHGEMPASVTWRYGKRVLAEGMETETEAAPVTSTDSEKIAEIYTALSNVIIVGNASSHLADEGYFISFALQDGSECRFDFISENTIRLSRHNYSIESDGTLWKALEGS